MNIPTLICFFSVEVEIQVKITTRRKYTIEYVLLKLKKQNALLSASKTSLSIISFNDIPPSLDEPFNMYET